MKIKRFVAPDMRTAFRMVREEHGPDAVILSNRRTAEGIEIVAASNYDEELVQRALETARSETSAAAHNAAAPIQQAPAPQAPTKPAAPVHAPLKLAANANVSQRQRVANAAEDMIAAMALRQPVNVPRQAPAAAPVRTASIPSPAAQALAHAVAVTTAPRQEHALSAVPEQLFADFLTTAPMQAPVQAPVHAAPVQACTPIMAAALATHASYGQDDDEQDDDGFDMDDALPQILPPAALPPIVVAPAAVAVAAAAPAPQNDEELKQLRGELALMRQMIEREMNRLTDERLRGSPARAQALELMDDYGFDAGLTRDVAMQIPADTELHRGRGLMLGLLSKRLPVAPVDPLERGGVIALVGPTGAGKTTTIAKLAQRFAAQHTPRDVALVTTDTQRVGGREQLHSYGRQLGIAVHEADSAESLLDLFERLRDYKLVLIDTAGMGQRDRALAAQLNWLRAAQQVTSLLVLPANAHFSDLDEVVRRFAHAKPQGVVLTKLDETGSFGSALSVVVDHQMPITWVTDGQRVPDDLHRANAASLVLRLEDLRRAADKPCTPEHNHAVA
ncbi:flagellar biosynthesis protein FlhF [Xanthomonas oryzae pv. oryzae]|uniref:flagellar biosynthesis protein FlhF n=1 Tax=Xanthomonas oryzae TaxID=347 RepID=UPI000949D45F|nr:flagellar biosynthesis protein FlhF [Xanthomonas oryzae]OLG40892.1 flagellar biosynthesis regulator FlhF [Xanthomonas oryzae pv. oryzae]OLG50136.1 flagellar biosynthesis regulator FlhF [Xanthomonas oryzae pv. oryzae]OLH42319.1 flagellar biosynthesis regulator FlhF [Xanthomonas oryzae pv. oryzae]OLH84346.1 flagellar biosynthesis regulator FlhF [Xanthomonas oryzae pv. oryzae]OLI69838.1 flagellar biosynthesis regulator FlhF [Xanthomonas oryzae pv. oryzae]